MHCGVYVHRLDVTYYNYTHLNLLEEVLLFIKINCLSYSYMIDEGLKNVMDYHDYDSYQLLGCPCDDQLLS